MLFDRRGYRALMSWAVAAGVSAGGLGGIGVMASQAAGWVAPAATTGGMLVRVQAAPQPAPCGPAPAAPCKESAAQPTDDGQAKPKAKEKQRRLTPCGPGIAPCMQP